MTALVEKGLKDFLDGALDSTLVIEAASATPLPDVEQYILVLCASVPHVAGPHGSGGLYDGEVEVVACTPSLVAGITEAQHRTLISLVQSVMVEDQAEAISAAMETAAGAKVQGWYLKESADEHKDGGWRTGAKYTFALEKV